MEAVSLLQDPEWINLIVSFWSHWQSMEGHADFPSLMDWWDQGKLYLREVSHTYERAKATNKHGRKASLSRKMRNLKLAFDRGDRMAFTHEAKGAQVSARCQWAEEGDFFLLLFEPGVETSCPADKVLYLQPCNWTGLPQHVYIVYTNAHTAVQTPFGEAAKIPILSGVKQGCLLSPIIFNLSVEIILRSISLLKSNC